LKEPEFGRPTDPFARHGELRGRTTDVTGATFYRAFNVETLVAEVPDSRWVLDLLHTDEQRESSRIQALAGHEGNDLWVFAYGSIMWNPAMHFAEVRHASLPGYSRRFILVDNYGRRGTRKAPGIVAALDHGERCEGLLFRIAADEIETETEVLWRREMIGPGYLPSFVMAEVDGEPVRALTFLADHAAEAIRPNLTFEDQVRFVAEGAGLLGTSRDYLASSVDQLAALGIHDEDCVTLLNAVDQHLASQ
jgi:cation transport protein ChaC